MSPDHHLDLYTRDIKPGLKQMTLLTLKLTEIRHKNQLRQKIYQNPNKTRFKDFKTSYQKFDNNETHYQNKLSKNKTTFKAITQKNS